jgi:hypothetical protein
MWKQGTEIFCKNCGVSIGITTKDIHYLDPITTDCLKFTTHVFHVFDPFECPQCEISLFDNLVTKPEIK